MSIDRVFVIGMPDAFRGAPLEAELGRTGIRSVRCDGVRVATESMDRLEEFDPASAMLLLRRRMSASELGCALAHQRVYARMIADRLGSAIVFEDDARLLRPLDLRGLADLLAVEHPRIIALHAPPGFAVVDTSRSHAGGAHELAFTAIVPPTTTTAYALNRSAAEVLSRQGRPISHVADWPIGAETHCEFLVLSEPVAAPDGSATSQIVRPTAGPRGGRRALGWLRRLLHVDWLRHRHVYGDYPTFVMHEFLRHPVYAWAQRRSQPDAGHAPLAASPMLTRALRTVSIPRVPPATPAKVGAGR